MYESGLDECFKYQEQIDKIRNLLNVDWAKLLEEEAQKYDNEIKKLFDIQKKKMDHFLNACVIKQNVDNKRIR